MPTHQPPDFPRLFTGENGTSQAAPALSRAEALELLAAVIKEADKFLKGLARSDRIQGSGFELDQILIELYAAAELQKLREVLSSFVTEHLGKLVSLYHAYNDDSRCSPVIFDSRIFLILERMEHDPYTLREAWNRHAPEGELDPIGAFWGTSL